MSESGRPMSAISASNGAGRHGGEGALALIRAELLAHEQRDDDRFSVVTASLEEVKSDVKELMRDVGQVRDDVGEIKGRLAVSAEGPDEWPVGPRVWALLSALAMLALGLISWLAVQVYDLQPARIRAATHAPAPIQIVRP
jgi:cytochrome c-type biogenesis protein CcmH/NrfG